MNVGEYGIAFNLNVSYNISAFTTLTLNITRPDATTISRTGADVTAPATPLVTSLGTFAANEYAKYYFKSGDLSQAGQYTVRLVFDNAAAVPPLHLVSDIASFTVNV